MIGLGFQVDRTDKVHDTRTNLFNLQQVLIAKFFKNNKVVVFLLLSKLYIPAKVHIELILLTLEKKK